MCTRGLLICFLLCFAKQAVLAQETKALILEKIGSKHRITYSIGDPIVLKLKGEDFEIRDEIADISDSILFLRDFFIPVNSIDYVKTMHTRGFLSPSNGPKIMIAGAALFIFDFLNQTLIQGETYKISEGVTIASASMIGFGGLLMSFKYRKFRASKNKRIRTLVL